MKISLEWLNDHLQSIPDAQTCADALTFGGLPVEVIEKHGDDTVIDVEVTSNRGDCLSHVGVARELSALRGIAMKQPSIAVSESNSSIDAAVSIEAPDLCPHYTARVIRNVKIQQSPQWMQRRLEALGVRPVNNVVDVTNYVMFEMGQPLHAFDYDRIAGRKIIVRKARTGEKLVSLDGHERKLEPDMLVIADASKAVALAGVMGGKDSEVSAATVNVLVESARFDPLSVRKTARALAMKSDSSYRFERGIDPTLAERASLRAAQLILKTAGGELLKGVASAGSGQTPQKKLKVRVARIAQVLGVELPVNEIIAAFTRLQLSPVQSGQHIEVTVPPHRLDLNIEVDLIEEAARVIGYDRIPMREEISVRLQPLDTERLTIDEIRTTLTASGYFEAVTFSFSSDALAESFVPPEAAHVPRADPVVRKADSRLRTSILPGLLEAVRRNEANGTHDARLFEIGSTFWFDRTGALEERKRLGVAGQSDLRELRGTVETLLTTLDKDSAVVIVPDSRAGFARGACGRIEWNGKPLGYLGRLDRQVAALVDLRGLPSIAELELAPLLAGTQHVPQLRPLPRFPSVRRDLSLVVSQSTRYQAIEQVVRDVKPDALEAIEYVTTYRGKPLAKDTKSVTITLVFRSDSGTLTSEQVERSVQRVIEQAKQRLNATLRE